MAKKKAKKKTLATDRFVMARAVKALTRMYWLIDKHVHHTAAHQSMLVQLRQIDAGLRSKTL